MAQPRRLFHQPGGEPGLYGLAPGRVILNSAEGVGWTCKGLRAEVDL